MSEESNKGQAKPDGVPVSGIQPVPVAQVVITAYMDRPVTIQSTVSPVMSLKLLSSGLNALANGLERALAGSALRGDAVPDRKREYLGPRKGD